jgi:pimeloyl-ACP methyl ester carboxylesterase
MLSSGFYAAVQYIVVGSIAASIHYVYNSFTLWRNTMKHKSPYYAQKAKHAARKPSPVLLGIALALGAMAAVVKYKTKQVELDNPPQGNFIDVVGIRLHYVEEGTGEPLVLIHGNGTMAQDYQISTIVEHAAKTYRVIAFDRPGYGYSDRPNGKTWDATAQAQLLHKALIQLGVDRPIVVGHSWGTLVALSLALEHPEYVRSLVLLSGYYYPMPRLDVVVSAPMAIPVIGHLLCHTVSPLFGRIVWPLAVQKLFRPSTQPARFKAEFPVWMSMRPSQLRASAGDGVMMIPEAIRLQERYRELRMPITIMAGLGDLLAISKLHSERLHEEILHSKLLLIPKIGHMIHQVVPDKVINAIDTAAFCDTTLSDDNATGTALKVA